MEWDLSVLYAGLDDPKLEADMKTCAAMLEAARVQADGFSAAGDQQLQLEKLLTDMEKMQGILERAASFVMLTLAVDTTCAEALKLMDQLQVMFVARRQLDSALVRLVGKIEDLDALICGSEVLGAYAFMLSQAKDEAGHLMECTVEDAVLNMQLTGGSAFEQLCEQLASELMVDMDGESIPLSAARNLAYSPDAAVRRRAYEAELKAYSKIELPMAACLNSIKGEELTMCGLKKYASPLERVLALSRMDQKTLDVMWQAVREAAPKFREYLRAKARYLGHEGGLPFYDLFAPMGEADMHFTLDEACEYLVRVLGKFNPAMGEFVRRAFEERWIDSDPKQGKQGGAFCQGIQSLGISRVLTNFDGSFSAVLTLAHELGHAWHGECLKNERIFNAEYPMPLAETASIFNETLVVSLALEEADADMRFALIETELQEATQTLLDIYSRYLFESEVFARRHEAGMTADELKEIMLSAQREAYGEGLDEAFMHPYMWACKSHYYSTELHFYNFPYAFGLLFGRGVFARYREAGAAFVPQYDAMLAACGRDTVCGVAARMEADLHDIRFWQASLNGLAEQIDWFVQEVDRRLAAK